MKTSQSGNSLPATNSLNVYYMLTLIITLIMTAVSISGNLFKAELYPSNDLVQAFLPNDVVNLVVGVPILLLSLFLTRRGKLIGLLLWPGALFYVLYNYLAYVFAIPFTLGFLPNLLLVALSTYSLIGLLVRIDKDKVKKSLSGSVPERLGSIIIIGFGAVFLTRVVVMSITAHTNQSIIPDTELAPMISDFIVCPAWLIGGWLLWQRKAFGYVTALGLLFQASMLFIGLIIFMLIQPGLTGTTLSISDVIIVAVLGLICFIPFGMFIRGVVNSQE